MTDFSYCVYQENGPWFSAGLVVVSIVVFLLGFALIGFFFRLVKDNSLGTVSFTFKDKTYGFHGVYLLLIFGVVICAAVPYGIWRAYDRYGNVYSVALDTGPRGLSLAAVQKFYRKDTNTKILIVGNAKNYSFKGRFSRRCTAGLFIAICKANEEQLECDHSFFNRSVSIKLRNSVN